MSVTTIERWIANPYAIFASHVLKLEELPSLGVRPGAALRGSVVHEALGKLTQLFPQRLPEDLAGELQAVVTEVLAGYMGDPRIAAFWAPRFGRFGEWLAATEPARRDGVTETVAEAEGKLVLDGPAGPFTLTARADRIDVRATGLVITDYKGSQSLDNLKRQAAQGEAPQLPLEAAIAAAGGFAGVPAARVLSLRYISTSGGEPPGQEIVIEGDPMALARAAQDGLLRLIAQFDREGTPYRALRRARFHGSPSGPTTMARRRTERCPPQRPPSPPRWRRPPATRPPPPIRPPRPGSAPTPAPARRTCSPCACCGSCSPAPSPRASSPSPTPRPPPPRCRRASPPACRNG
jgi:ATP-dependent helicase/nuclease subunit B